MPFLRSLRKFFYDDRIVLVFLILSILVNLTSWVFVALKIGGSTELRATSYSVYFGATFGPPQLLFEIPAMGSFIVLSNSIIAYFLHKRNVGYAEILMGATAFLQALTFIPLLAIYYFGNIT